MKLRRDALGRDGLGYTCWALVVEEGLRHAFPETTLTDEAVFLWLMVRLV